MTERLKRLCDEIRQLEPDEQAYVLHMLSDLGDMPEPDVERAWMSEAQRRARLLKAEAAEAQEAPTATSREAVNNYLKRRPSAR